jgi:hypothetical protein
MQIIRISLVLAALAAAALVVASSAQAAPVKPSPAQRAMLTAGGFKYVGAAGGYHFAARTDTATSTRKTGRLRVLAAFRGWPEAAGAAVVMRTRAAGLAYARPLFSGLPNGWRLASVTPAGAKVRGTAALAEYRLLFVKGG